MFTLSPHDTPISDNASDLRDRNFGGQRQFTTGKQVKDQDYTGRDCGAPNVKENPAEETAHDIDEMTEFESRKREFSRRAETEDRSDNNKEYFHTADAGNRPLEDNSAVLVPDHKKHGDKLKYHFGSGQYDNYPNRGNYEGEVR